MEVNHLNIIFIRYLENPICWNVEIVANKEKICDRGIKEVKKPVVC